MENQPAPTPISTLTPTPTPTPAPAPTPTPTPALTPTPASAAISNNAPDSTKKKNRKGIVIGLICLLVVLLGGGGFAVAYTIANQPENIVASSLGNLINAKQVALDGNINVTLSPDDFEEYDGYEDLEDVLGINSVTIGFNSQKSTSGNTTSATISATYDDGSTTTPVNIGEVFLSDGVLYLEANGIKDFYYNDIYSRAHDSLVSQLENSYQSQLYYDCYDAATSLDEYDACDAVYEVEFDPETEASIEQAMDDTLNQIGEIVESLDGQWIEVSIDDIMDNEVFSYVDAATRRAIIDGYHCTVNKLNDLQSYSTELSDLYGQNSFVVITPAQDSFYDISFDAAKLAGYINSAPKTKLASDIAGCFSTTIPADYDAGATTEKLQPYLNYLPKISAKFDGVFDHHLTELKLNTEQELYSVTSDLKFSYPGDITISAPTNSRPIMDVIEEVSQKIQNINSNYN